MPKRAFLHLAPSEYAAKSVRNALASVGRDDEVIGWRDSYSDGPLSDADGDATLRAGWWSRLRGESVAAADLRDADLWDRVRASPAAVVLWHGPHAAEAIFAKRACFHLPDREPYEATTPGRTGRLPAFYGAVAISSEEDLVEAWRKRARVSDAAARAAEWLRLRADGGEWLRDLDGETIVHLPLTAHDDELVRTCRGDWRGSILVVGTVLTVRPRSDAFLFWRVRELLAAGVLEGRGAPNRVGLPDEVRPASPR